ncbi:MAG TPA: SpoIIE family protein phosphatase [bacterium]|nr:SpoIIE family protein phosphatase [bacterium]
MENRSRRRSDRIVLPAFGLAAELVIALAVFAGTSLIVSALRFSFPDSETFLFIYVPVVGAAAYVGGRRSGLVLAFLAIGSTGYYRFTPALDLTPGNLLSVGLFALVAVLTALAPARLRDIERKAEKADEHLMLLADASALLGEGFEHETSLKHVVDLTVPRFADWCVVELVEDDAARVVALAHADAARGSVLEELYRSHPRAPGVPGDARQIVRTRQAELVSEISNSPGEATAQDPQHLSLLGALGTRTILRAPVRHNEEIDGVLAFGRGYSRPRFDPADQLFAEDLGRRCGVAVALGRAYARQRAIAETLQRNLLPQRLPELPAVAVSARYLPSDGDIGGDWYDVIPLPDGQIALAMGDVAGRGVDAAALMGQLRTALQVLALEGYTPSVILQRLDTLLHQLPLTQMVTLVYMVVSTEAMRIRFTNAGHPPPLVVAPDRTTRYLVEGSTVPLGVRGPLIPAEAEVPIPAESTVVLYSDGLVERRGVALEHGLAALEGVVQRGPIDPEAICSRLVQELAVGRSMHDDVALLALQVGVDTAGAGRLNR